MILVHNENTINIKVAENLDNSLKWKMLSPEWQMTSFNDGHQSTELVLVVGACYTAMSGGTMSNWNIRKWLFIKVSHAKVRRWGWGPRGVPMFEQFQGVWSHGDPPRTDRQTWLKTLPSLHYVANVNYQFCWFIYQESPHTSLQMSPSIISLSIKICQMMAFRMWLNIYLHLYGIVSVILLYLHKLESSVWFERGFTQEKRTTKATFRPTPSPSAVVHYRIPVKEDGVLTSDCNIQFT